MATDLFYFDDSQSIKITYDRLWRDVDVVEDLPQVLVFEDCYELFVSLLAAIHKNTNLILVDHEQDRAAAEDWLAKHPAPHPQPLSPEYRGEGSQNQGGEPASFDEEYRGEGSENQGYEPASLDEEYRGEGSENQGYEPASLDEEYRGEGSDNQGYEPASLDEEYRGEGSDNQGRAPASLNEDCRDEGSENDASRAWRNSASREASVFDHSTNAASRCRVGLLTSGTTGKPKLVLHALDSLTRAVRIGEQYRSAVWGLAYHPAHFAGLQVFFQALCNGNSIVRLFGLDAEHMHDAIEKQSVTHLSATPTLMRLLSSSERVHTQVRHVTVGGERSEPELLTKLKRLFPQATFRNVYASTEVGSLLASQGDVFHVPARYDGLIKIVDDELAVHRSLLAASLQANCQHDFYSTGDCVEVIQQTPLRFRLISRRGDFINVGGFKVNPHEVEDQINLMPEVKESFVYGQPNSVTGNLVCCDLVLHAGRQLTTRELIARLADCLPDYKIPRIMRLVCSLPVTSTGKRGRRA